MRILSDLYQFAFKIYDQIYNFVYLGNHIIFLFLIHYFIIINLNRNLNQKNKKSLNLDILTIVPICLYNQDIDQLF
jgi:hypothetical protein